MTASFVKRCYLEMLPRQFVDKASHLTVYSLHETAVLAKLLVTPAQCYKAW